MKITQIPVLQDNYVWLLTDQNSHTVIIDPGVAKPVMDYLQQHALLPVAILLTHHHHDHTGGVTELLQHYPNLTVYGSQETQQFNHHHLVSDGDVITIGLLDFRIIATPGHTLHHIAFYCQPYLFCGDTLFSAGCGRVFEGTMQQMYHSLLKLAQLPNNTYLCCSHEYTLSNLNFAHSLLPDDTNISQYRQHIIQLRQNGQSSLPSLMSLEKKINLFLRCEEQQLKQQLLANNNSATGLELFTLLRQKKDHY